MKKIFAILISIIMIFSVLPVTVFAENNKTIVSETIEYLDDGSYIVTTLVEETNVTRATSTKTGSKTAIHYNSDDEKVVTMKLTATFSYTGSSATCTAASTSYTIHDDSWKVTTATASKSGNKATGNFTVKHYVLLVPIQTVNTTITITCSNSGTLS